jgi:ATP-dependent RNA helicase DeaD
LNNFKEFDLDPLLIRGVEKLGFGKPFPIQEYAIGPLLAGSDVIGQAKTGTGKTAAYGLPMLQKLHAESKEVQALVLAPTRELALQISAEIDRLGTYTGARVLTIYGGQSINIQFEALRRGVHVVVGTPGRVIDHLKRGTLRLDSVSFVVLDEADTMLDMGFVDDIEFILDSIPGRRQTSLFSATMPKRIVELSGRYMNNPEKILIDSDEPSVDTLDQYYAVVEQRAKLTVLMDLLTRLRPFSSMIFCRTKRGTHTLAEELERHLLNVAPLHGDLSQSQRDHSMKLFRSGRVDVLVATDVASRGIDVQQVDCVVNYEVPQDPLLYFHRVGRTARAGNSGSAYTFVSQEEFDDFARICSLTKAKIKPLRPEDEGHVFATTRIQNRPWNRRSRQSQSYGWSRNRRQWYR